MRSLAALALTLTCSIACSGSGTKAAAKATPTDPPHKAAPALDVGGDYASYTKLNQESWPSETHGGRYVDVYVNDVGLAAYKNADAKIPVGTIVVKTSWEVKNGNKTDIPGPIFVMKKMEPGFDSENEDWWYGFHWAEPAPRWKKQWGGGVYWKSPSAKVGYCVECHESYDRYLGGLPEDE